MNQRWLRLTGLVLGAAGVIFVARQAWQMRSDIAALANDVHLLLVIAACAPAYAIALTWLAVGWAHLLLARSGEPRPPRRQLIKIFASSSIAKYLPGNVLHFAGRQVLAGQLGMPQKHTAMASLAESLCTLAAGLTLAIVALAAQQAGPVWSLPVVAVTAVTLWLTRQRPLSLMFALSAAFFVASLGMLAALIAVLSLPAALFVPVSFAYLLAWAAGNVVPGAPGGLGVREAAFVALCAGIDAGPASAMLLIAVAMRIISLAGDLLFFAIGALMRNPSPSPNQVKPS